MAIVQVTTATSREAYDVVERTLNLSDNRPNGMIVHAAAEQPDGSVLIVDVWESNAAMDAFERGRLFPAFASAPGAAMTEPPTRHPTFHLVRS
jgi:quinol monooxygenase YgiN